MYVVTGDCIAAVECRWRSGHHANDRSQSRSTRFWFRSALPLRLGRWFLVLGQMVQRLSRYDVYYFNLKKVEKFVNILYILLSPFYYLEFFGYVPKETPQFRVFPWSNFTIHVSRQHIFIIVYSTSFNYYYDDVLYAALACFLLNKKLCAFWIRAAAAIFIFRGDFCLSTV